MANSIIKEDERRKRRLAGHRKRKRERKKEEERKRQRGRERKDENEGVSRAQSREGEIGSGLRHDDNDGDEVQGDHEEKKKEDHGGIRKQTNREEGKRQREGVRESVNGCSCKMIPLAFRERE